MPCCRALVFDFDGVIIESEHIKTRAFRELYGEHGPEVVAAAVAHHEANGGISRRKKIRHCHATLLGIELDTARLEALCQRFSALVEDEVVGCDWVPGASEVLATHFGRRPMFVVSGTPQGTHPHHLSSRPCPMVHRGARIAAGEGGNRPLTPRPIQS